MMRLVLCVNRGGKDLLGLPGVFPFSEAIFTKESARAAASLTKWTIHNAWKHPLSTSVDGTGVMRAERSSD
eukprot:365296-Chlamydomonas_euryale.AAC.18